VRVWRRAKTKVAIAVWGGPQDTMGVWNVKVLVKGNVVRRGKVTVAC
jgi:hypothetical protein